MKLFCVCDGFTIEDPKTERQKEAAAVHTGK